MPYIVLFYLTLRLKAHSLSNQFTFLLLNVEFSVLPKYTSTHGELNLQSFDQRLTALPLQYSSLLKM